MYRVCSELLVKSQRQLTRHRMSSQATRNEEATDRRLRLLQMQLEHDMEMKKLEYAQKQGLEHLGVSRDTASILTVGGKIMLVVSSGAWFVSQLLVDLITNQNENMRMRSFTSSGHYPKEAELRSQQVENKARA